MAARGLLGAAALCAIVFLAPLPAHAAKSQRALQAAADAAAKAAFELDETSVDEPAELPAELQRSETRRKDAAKPRLQMPAGSAARREHHVPSARVAKATAARADEPSDESVPQPEPEEVPEPTADGSEPFPIFSDGSEPPADEVYYEPAFDDMALGSPSLGLVIPRLRPGLQFSGGILFLQPGADNLGYAVLTNEKNESSPLPLAQPFWAVESVIPGYQPGFQFGASYAFARLGTDFQVNWQHLRTKSSGAAAVVQSDGQWISPFSQTGPPTADSYDQIAANPGVDQLKYAQADAFFAYDAVNFDFGQYVTIGSGLSLRGFAGLTYARVQEKLLSTFLGTPPAPGTPFPASVPLAINLNETSTFSGVGPRLGFDGAVQTRSGLSFTGQLAGDLLIGTTQPAQYQFTATSPELAAVGIPVNYEQIGSHSFMHVVYAVSAKLGMGYSFYLPGGAALSVDGGYLAALYLNPFQGYETNNNVLALQIGSLSSASVRQTLSNFSLNGFYLNGSINW